MIADRSIQPQQCSCGGRRYHCQATAQGQTIRPRLKVLGFCDYFVEPMSGGSELVTLEVYKRFEALGIEPRVVSAVPQLKQAQWTEVRGVSTRAFPMVDLTRYIRLQVGVSPGLTRDARRVVEDFSPDVIHGSSIHFQSTLAAARLARQLDLPFVTTAHLSSVQHLATMAKLATTAYERSVGRFILETSSRVIAVSDSVAVHLNHLGVSPEKIVVVENGVDTQRFRPGDRAETRQVVFVGRLIANKGPAEALEAFARAASDGWRLLFAGDGPMRSGLERRAGELGLSDKVEFLGLVRDVAPLLGSSSILVRPSLTEGRPLAVLEAMASGMCVMISDIAPNRELVDHGRTGILVPLDDPDGWVRALQDLMQDVRGRSAMGEAAREAVSSASWEAVAERTGSVLAAVAEHRCVS